MSFMRYNYCFFEFPLDFSMDEIQDLMKETLRQLNIMFGPTTDNKRFLFEPTETFLATHHSVAIILDRDSAFIVFYDQCIFQSIEIYIKNLHSILYTPQQCELIYKLTDLLKHNMQYAIRKNVLLLVESHNISNCCSHTPSDNTCESFGFNYMMNELIFKEILSYNGCDNNPLRKYAQDNSRNY